LFFDAFTGGKTLNIDKIGGMPTEFLNQPALSNTPPSFTDRN
jgi:hypothetical protein